MLARKPRRHFRTVVWDSKQRVGCDAQDNCGLGRRNCDIHGDLGNEVRIGCRLCHDPNRIDAALQARRWHNREVARGVDGHAPTGRGRRSQCVSVGEGIQEMHAKRHRRILVGGQGL